MKLPCTLKLRHTGSSNHGRGGEGAMITENLSCTLAAAVQDQTLFTGGALCYDGYNQRAYEEVSMTLRSAMTGTEGNDADPKVAYGIDPVERVCGGETPFVELSRTIDAGHGRAGSGVLQTVGFKEGQSANGGLGDEREVSPTLSHKPSALEPTVAQSGVKCLNPQDQQTGRVYDPSGAMTSLQANGGVSGQRRESVLMSDNLAAMHYIVRRLTPKEAERLMGLPDGYTIPTGLRRFFDANGEPSPELVSEFVDSFDKFNAIMAEYEHKKPPKGKSYDQVAAWLKKISDPATCPDSPRYKGCGNGWATNQPRWILTRLLSIGEGIDPFTGEEP